MTEGLPGQGLQTGHRQPGSVHLEERRAARGRRAVQSRAGEAENH